MNQFSNSIAWLSGPYDFTLPKVVSAALRFRKKVEQNGEDCWEWQGAIKSNGYGNLGVGGSRKQGGRTIGAHKFAWIMSYGAIPEGQCVLHSCDNRRCVNPTHLFLGTKAENSQDMTVKGRQTRGSLVSNARLTELQVAAIRRLLREGSLQKEIAPRFGVHAGTIQAIAAGRNWRHLNADS